MLYAIKMTDGSVAVMTTVGDTEAEAEIAKWHEDARSLVVSVHPIEGSDLPQDRTFRDAWVFDGKKVTHDMPKVRDVHRDRLRRARIPKFEALDVAYQCADEAGDAGEKRRIGQRKQALRDVTADPRIEAAQTPDELKGIWPRDLA